MEMSCAKFHIIYTTRYSTYSENLMKKCQKFEMSKIEILCLKTLFKCHYENDKFYHSTVRQKKKCSVLARRPTFPQSTCENMGPV